VSVSNFVAGLGASAGCVSGVTCTFDSDDGRDIVRRLAQDADVFVQNFRPGTLDRHGLGYDDLRVDHEDLVYVSLSGFGAVGPYAGKSAYDTVIQAYAGFGANQADPPTASRCSSARPWPRSPAHRRQAITAALHARERGQAAARGVVDARRGGVVLGRRRGNRC
jgi:crotonobetainyl-CoA:carnitine CoA-transferase CaiB-like acyl-CoA transferase